MKQVFRMGLLMSVLSSGACSHSTPDIVAGLSGLQVPVIQRTPEMTNSNQYNNKLVFSENAKEISSLKIYLKKNYLEKANVRDIFDDHSLSHEVYIALTNLEQSDAINEKYLSDGNTQGLIQLHQTLHPFVSKI
ncbi:hypothetical protein ACJBF7_25845 [Enterobacter sp. 04-C-01-SI_S15]|uniref:hypothetical protein n=1 Tax=Enterobacteriaceae TaxID=543 RepID=UPI001BCB2226|nr:hypothetical protein [Citrobacter freundii]HBM9969854.1 hypothetical protein [Enterobacter chengduensis]EKW1517886.1 hypothetical protein [Citrobacter freundii]EKW7471319.1 hypothetical protein [Citrobacter freundii]HBH6881759.1 hypothetical protein [Citrobacter freundii]HBH6984892.1 hypothetical protein [Citrobacter freundii]